MSIFVDFAHIQSVASLLCFAFCHSLSDICLSCRPSVDYLSANGRQVPRRSLLFQLPGPAKVWSSDLVKSPIACVADETKPRYSPIIEIPGNTRGAEQAFGRWFADRLYRGLLSSATQARAQEPLSNLPDLKKGVEFLVKYSLKNIKYIRCIQIDEILQRGRWIQSRGATKLFACSTCNGWVCLGGQRIFGSKSPLFCYNPTGSFDLVDFHF